MRARASTAVLVSVLLCSLAAVSEQGWPRKPTGAGGAARKHGLADAPILAELRPTIRRALSKIGPSLLTPWVASSSARESGQHIDSYQTVAIYLQIALNADKQLCGRPQARTFGVFVWQHNKYFNLAKDSSCNVEVPSDECANSPNLIIAGVPPDELLTLPAVFQAPRPDAQSVAVAVVWTPMPLRAQYIERLKAVVGGAAGADLSCSGVTPGYPDDPRPIIITTATTPEEIQDYYMRCFLSKFEKRDATRFAALRVALLISHMEHGAEAAIYREDGYYTPQGSVVIIDARLKYDFRSGSNYHPQEVGHWLLVLVAESA